MLFTLHSALVQPRRQELVEPRRKELASLRRFDPTPARIAQFLRFELIDVIVAMNGAWLINSAMILMAAVALASSAQTTVQPSIQDAYHTLGPLFGPAAATMFAVALLCSGLSSSTVGVLAGQVIIEGFLDVKFPVFLRRSITIVPAIAVIATGLDPLKVLVLSQVVLSFALPFALVPLLILTSRTGVMQLFASRPSVRLAGWVVVSVVIALNAIYLGSLAFSS